ncbi:MAG: SWIM zinc finger family protein [Hyphomicrobiaceae bacterium]
MRSSESLATLICGLASAVFCVALVFIAPDLASAQETASSGPQCSCPDANAPVGGATTPRPRLAGIGHRLGQDEEVATLEAIQWALTEAGDGSSYVWHGRKGRISGVIQPTMSFRGGNGHICRHIVVVLSAAGYSRTAEGIACRDVAGLWKLEG